MHLVNTAALGSSNASRFPMALNGGARWASYKNVCVGKLSRWPQQNVALAPQMHAGAYFAVNGLDRWPELRVGVEVACEAHPGAAQ